MQVRKAPFNSAFSPMVRFSLPRSTRELPLSCGLMNFAVFCYTVDGVLDTTFGGGYGIVTTDSGDNNHRAEGFAVLLSHRLGVTRKAISHTMAQKSASRIKKIELNTYLPILLDII